MAASAMLNFTGTSNDVEWCCTSTGLYIRNLVEISLTVTAIMGCLDIYVSSTFDLADGTLRKFWATLEDCLATSLYINEYRTPLSPRRPLIGSSRDFTREHATSLAWKRSRSGVDCGFVVFPSNTMWPGPRLTCMPSFVMNHPTIWPQYTNVTEWTGQDRWDRQTGELSDSIGRTVLQTVAQKRSSRITLVK